MIEVKRIFPECDAETLLVELLLQRGKPGHRHGITEVIEALANYPSDHFIIGIADTDRFKRKTEGILSFSEVVDNKLEKEEIIVYQKPASNKYLIRIHPAFERWIWKIAEENDIHPGEYGISSYEEFVHLSKHYGTTPDARFKKFVNAIVRKSPAPPPIQTLYNWLHKVIN